MTATKLLRRRRATGKDAPRLRQGVMKRGVPLHGLRGTPPLLDRNGRRNTIFVRVRRDVDLMLCGAYCTDRRPVSGGLPFRR
jgi:hypothetical protein